MRESENLPDRRKPPTFAEVLASINSGVLAEELTDELCKLVAAIEQRARTTGGKPKGELKFTLKLMHDRGIMEVEADVTVKEPKVVRQREIMYGGLDGSLTKHSPQIDAFRDVSTKDPAQIRIVHTPA